MEIKTVIKRKSLILELEHKVKKISHNRTNGQRQGKLKIRKLENNPGGLIQDE